MALCTNDSVSVEKKRSQLNENMPDENVHNVSQSDLSIKENTTGNSFNNEVTTVQAQQVMTMKLNHSKCRPWRC